MSREMLLSAQSHSGNMIAILVRTCVVRKLTTLDRLNVLQSCTGHSQVPQQQRACSSAYGVFLQISLTSRLAHAFVVNPNARRVRVQCTRLPPVHPILDGGSAHLRTLQASRPVRIFGQTAFCSTDGESLPRCACLVSFACQSTKAISQSMRW